MEAFKIEIAGLVTCVQPLFESTREYCRPYLTERQSDFFVCVNHDDLIFQQTLLEHEALEEGIKVRKFKEPFLERAVIQRRIADRLLLDDTLLLHGSTVSVDGHAYLFTAPCGTGKSTHTRLWREVFGQRAIMVNDDKPFLRITTNGVLACGSPWSGKHGLDANISVPLKGICILSRGKSNEIRRVEPYRSIGMLHHQAHCPVDIALREKASSLVNALADMVPIWEMHCNQDAEAAIVSYSAMSAV